MPYPSIREMAAADVKEIRQRQPVGPYTLWGYSFGARVAFEAAHQLEQSGELVERVFLIAPGSPRVGVAGERPATGIASFADKSYVAVLFSVFAGRIEHPELAECLRVAEDTETFASFIARRFDLEPDLVRRITTVAHRTFGMGFDTELVRRLDAPITVFRARGDSPSFIDEARGHASNSLTIIDLEADHYSMLREPDIGELIEQIRWHLRSRTEEAIMPHVNIKHHPVVLSEAQQAELVARVTEAVKAAFRCDEGVISIALEPVDKEAWNDRVYVPEIVNRKELLRKVPSY